MGSRKYTKNSKIFVDKQAGGWYTNLAKQRRLTASASPPAHREEVKNEFTELPVPAVRCCAGAFGRPRFVILRMEVL